jgi:uncharacterized membrane protein YgaE (UPF0421/DUF939 family)
LFKEEPRKRGEFECRFDLDKYTLKQINEAYKVYTQTLDTLKMNEAMVEKYLKAKASENQEISDQEALDRMASEESQTSKEVVAFFSNPYCLALLKLIELYNQMKQDNDCEQLAKVYNEKNEFVTNDDTVI